MENRFGLYWSDPSSDVPLLGQLTPNEQETATSPLQQNSQTQASEEITSSPVQQISDSVLSTSSYSKTPVDRGSIIDTNTNNVTPETTKYKIKPGSMSDSYRKRRKREIERQAKIRREAKLPKRTVSVGEKHQKNGLPTRENLESDQTTMTQAFPTRSELKNFKEETKQIARIQSKPHPFDPKDEVPDSALMDFYRSDERFEFERFLERQDKSLNEQPRPKKKGREKFLVLRIYVVKDVATIPDNVIMSGMVSTALTPCELFAIPMLNLVSRPIGLSSRRHLPIITIMHGILNRLVLINLLLNLPKY